MKRAKQLHSLAICNFRKKHIFYLPMYVFFNLLTKVNFFRFLVQQIQKLITRLLPWWPSLDPYFVVGWWGGEGGDCYHVQRGGVSDSCYGPLFPDTYGTVRTVHTLSATDAKHSSKGAFTADFKRYSILNPVMQSQKIFEFFFLQIHRRHVL